MLCLNFSMTLDYFSSEYRVPYESGNKCNYLKTEAKIMKIKFAFLRDRLFGLPFSMCSQRVWWGLYSISENMLRVLDSKTSQKRMFSQSSRHLILCLLLISDFKIAINYNILPLVSKTFDYF